MTGGPGADPALPSLLPEWTRGHVLTHIARNADSFVRVLEAAPARRRWSPSTRAASPAATPTSRRAPAATGTPSSPTCGRRRARLDDVFATQDRWDLAMTNSPGESVPHADLPFRRLREVVVHHADLGDDGLHAGRLARPTTSARTCGGWRCCYSARQPMGVTGLPEAALQRHAAGAAVLAARPRRDRRALQPAGSSAVRGDQPADLSVAHVAVGHRSTTTAPCVRGRRRRRSGRGR